MKNEIKSMKIVGPTVLTKQRGQTNTSQPLYEDHISQSSTARITWEECWLSGILPISPCILDTRSSWKTSTIRPSNACRSCAHSSRWWDWREYHSSNGKRIRWLISAGWPREKQLSELPASPMATSNPPPCPLCTCSSQHNARASLDLEARHKLWEESEPVMSFCEHNPMCKEKWIVNAMR